MTKIAIISQPEQGVLVDVGGCTTLQEATQHLTSTLQVSSEFWDQQAVDLNLGNLSLSADDMAQILSIVAERGIKPRHIFSESETTKASLEAHNIKPASGSPASLQPDGTISGGTPGEAAQAALSETLAEVACATESSTKGGDACAPSSEKKPEGTTAETEAATSSDTKDAPSSEPPTKTTAPAAPAVPHVLYLRQTLRSGQAISHKGNLVIIGDVNPGAEVMADGDITIWGALRGIAHAGVGGNVTAEIRALKFDPIQLRIAHAIARSPDRPKVNLTTNGPETARIVNGIIRISSSAPE